MNSASRLLFTIIYADMFHYPLTHEELMLWIPKKMGNAKGIQRTLRTLIKQKKIDCSRQYYFLRGHTSNIEIRLRRGKEARSKWRNAKFAALLLRIVPTITFIGVTGGVALGNADREDDIDFFVGTESHALWFTRFWVTMIMEIIGIRRRPGDTDVTNCICLNMFVSEDGYAVAPKERDIYTAHEVLQLVPLWERNGAYGTFLKKNRWVSHFFPAQWKNHKPKKMTAEATNKRTQRPIGWLVGLFEPWFKQWQINYMKKRRTQEVVTDSVIRFHPHNSHIWVKKAVKTTSKRFKIPLDKDFFQT